jgi:hypothetical protein
MNPLRSFHFDLDSLPLGHRHCCFKHPFAVVAGNPIKGSDHGYKRRRLSFRCVTYGHERNSLVCEGALAMVL